MPARSTARTEKEYLAAGSGGTTREMSSTTDIDEKSVKMIVTIERIISFLTWDCGITAHVVPVVVKVRRRGSQRIEEQVCDGLRGGNVFALEEHKLRG